MKNLVPTVFLKHSVSTAINECIQKMPYCLSEKISFNTKNTRDDNNNNNSVGLLDQIIFHSFCLDTESKIYLLVSVATELVLFRCEFSLTHEQSTADFLLNFHKEQLLEDDQPVITSFAFVPELDSVCFTTEKGEILQYDVRTREAELVGIISSGITCAAWSPDYELVVFTTKENTLVLMNSEWSELASEKKIEQEDLKTKRRAVQLKSTPLQQPAPQTENTESPKTEDSARHHISWRGDGSFFAINTENRVFIYERSGEFHALSEQMASNSPLGSSVAWRPIGDLIAVPRNLPNKRQVVFFERNGLQHGDLTWSEHFPSDQWKYFSVQNLLWNSESDLLAVLLICPSAKSHILQIWSRNNYHWYLKQSFRFDSRAQIQAMQWDETRSTTLRTLSLHGEVSQFQFVWEAQTTVGSFAHNPVCCSVIDGPRLLLTPFRWVCPPPPLAHQTLQTGGPIVQFAFSAKCHMLAVLQEDRILMYPHDNTARNFGLASSSRLELVQSAFPQIAHMRQLHWIDENTLLAVVTNVDQPDDLVEFSVDFQRAHILVEDSVHIVSAKAPILKVTHHPVTRHTFVQFIDGSVALYKKGAVLESCTLGENEQPFVFPNPSPRFLPLIFNGQETLVGLDASLRLYLGRTLLSSECNSFGIHHKYLCFATISNKLKFVPLDMPLDQRLLADQPATEQTTTSSLLAYNDLVREVERGAQVVAVVPFDIKVVLQMPRGNLEGIYPRILVLDMVKTLLDKHKYGVAFALMRKHRIDLNLIYDHDPKDFLNNLQAFVSQVDSVEFFNLFLSTLREEDTTRTIFSSSYADRRQEIENQLNIPSFLHDKQAIQHNKRNLICENIRPILESTNKTKFLLSILTTYIVKEQPELETVLKIVQTMKATEKVEIVDVDSLGSTETPHIGAEKALKYICWLVNVNTLYDIALGMYDFELVVMVAHHSQKDPKEYLNFLSELQQMEKFYQRFMIDKHLGRFESALDNLAQAGDSYFPEVLELVKEQKLFKRALRIYQKRDRPDQFYFKVLEQYGEALLKEQNYAEAGFHFYTCKQTQKALNAFSSTSDWQMSFTCAFDLAYTPEQIDELASQVVENLRSLKMFEEAVRVLTLHKREPFKPILDLLVESGQWLEAIQHVKRNQAHHPSLEFVKNALLEAWKSCVQENKTAIEEWEKRTTRLRVVQRNKFLLGNLATNSDVKEGGDTSSMISGMSAFSEASTVQSYTSQSSGYSGYRSLSSYGSQSSKVSEAKREKKRQQSIKKQQRQSRRGREGSPFEEDFLLETINGLIPSTEYQGNVHRILQGLAFFDLQDCVEELEVQYQKRIDLILDNLDDFIPLQHKMIKVDKESVPMVNNPLLVAYHRFIKEKLPQNPWKLLKKEEKKKGSANRN